MSAAVDLIKKTAKANGFDVDDLGNMTVSILKENYNDPIGAIISREQVKEDSEEIKEVAKDLAKVIEEERENETRNKEEN